MNFDHYLTRRMRIMLLAAGLLFGGIFIYKGITALAFKWYLYSNKPPAIEVSAMKVGYGLWKPQLTSTANLRAIRGVNISSEVPGMVRTIYFAPGATVTQKTVLVQLNADSDLAALHSLEANAALAEVTYLRDKAQYAINAVSKQTLDADAANLKSLRAQVAQQAALLAKKTIRAPFDGRLGITKVNPGQYLNPGDPIVNLQTLDPIYADFFLPQQTLAKLKVGQAVTLTSDTFPGQIFKGSITTINPAVESSTRNIEVEATIANPKHELTPGMFTVVTVVTGDAERKLTLPQTAISFNPYGELVYIVRKTGEGRKGKPILTAKQAFIVTGEARGDQVAILKGLQEGDTVVTSGQLKLKNGSEVTINNAIVPDNNPNPKVSDEH